MDFSPCERYIVTYSPVQDTNTQEPSVSNKYIFVYININIIIIGMSWNFREIFLSFSSDFDMSNVLFFTLLSGNYNMGRKDWC